LTVFLFIYLFNYFFSFFFGFISFYFLWIENICLGVMDDIIFS